jgi:hypothetical protein
MAIAAIYSVIAHVMFVTELNGLFLRLERARGICGPAQLGQDPGNDGEYKYGSEDGKAGYGVSAAFENLGHTTRSRAEFRTRSVIEVLQRPESSGRMKCRDPIGSIM